MWPVHLDSLLHRVMSKKPVTNAGIRTVTAVTMIQGGIKVLLQSSIKVIEDTATFVNEPHREKTSFCICENKDTDQLRGNRKADQRLCFHYTDSTIPLLSRSEISSCAARFMSDLVGNPEDRFSHDKAQILG